MRVVGVHTYSAGASTGYGVPAPSWEPPLDEPGEDRQVYGWAPHSTDELSGVEPNRLVEIELDLLVPPGFQIAPEDVVDVEGEQFQVVGEALDYGCGRFAYNPGMVVRLKRV